MEAAKYVDVIIPISVPNLYTYSVPKALLNNIEIGKRVIVQFGTNKLYTAIIRKIHNKKPQHYKVKEIIAVLDDEKIINDKQFELFEWISKYYLCNLGDVINAALPSALKLTSETVFLIHPDFNGDLTGFNNNEIAIIDAISLNGSLTLKDISKIVGRKNIYILLKKLIDRGIIIEKEELNSKYFPKKVSYVKILCKKNEEEKLKEFFNKVEKAPKQLKTLITYLELSKFNEQNLKEVRKIELQKKAGVSSSIINIMQKKGIFTVYEKTESRLEKYIEKLSPIKKLNDYQKKAYNEIKEHFSNNKIVLLHGVTSSGKTEIYVNLIREQILKGKQVLYLLPEIALTTQIIGRLKKYFGNLIAVYHSRFNANEKVEIWNSINSYKIILGARSSIFLPFSNLGLIIVDEEHETTFKQYDPSPRYNARDTAIILSKIHNANIILGSATPSIESYYNAKNNKYALVEITKRYGNVKMPNVNIVDLKKLYSGKKINSNFSPILIKEIQKCIKSKEQIILFKNRRGYAPVLLCKQCGWSPQCHQCDVTLTYHKNNGNLICHYCNFNTKLYKQCLACGSFDLTLKGQGTEKIEEELKILFPDINIERLDLDTTRNKYSYQNIISRFEDKDIDILVGTQMITKGLDFDNVGLVGILNADNLLRFPNFRAFERSFQLMSQVSGRAGRKNKQGKVIIQTFVPNHPVINYVKDNNFAAMYQMEIIHRSQFKYPPFSRLIKIILKHKKENILNEAALNLTKILKGKLGVKRVLGPDTPIIPRIKNYYIKNILIKIERKFSINKAKEIITENINYFKKNNNTSVKILIDVDPY